MGEGDSLLEIKKEQAFGRHAVEIFVTSLEKAVKTSRIYEGDLSHPSLEAVYRNVLEALRNAYDEKGLLELLIKPLEILFQRKPVYSNADRRHSLSFALFSDGIRFLNFREGFDLPQLQKLVGILATDFSKPEFMDQDLYGLMIEAHFEHLQATSIDLLAQMTKENPDLKAKMQEFMGSVSRRTVSRLNSVARNLRSDDLKVLEEFRLNPRQFVKPDEEVNRVVHSVIHHQTDVAKEKEILEKMLWMGLHVLLNSNDIAELEAGRSLVVRTAMDLLEQNHLASFRSLIERLHGFQRDQPSKTGELQKALDQIFHPDHADYFAKPIEQQDDFLRMLVSEPPTSVSRLMVELLREKPSLAKTHQEFYLKNLPAQATWLESSFQKDPEGKAWEPLLSILGQKPHPSLRAFFELVLRKGNAVMRTRSVRALALIGTPDALRPLQGLLNAKEEATRLLVLESLAAVKTRPAVLLMKSHIEKSTFEQFSEVERITAFQSLIDLAEETALPWFQGYWNSGGVGLFKKRQETERRLLVIKAIGRKQPKFIEELIRQTPGLSEEVVSEWKKIAPEGSGS